MEERPRGLSSTGRKRGTAVLNIPRGETKVVLQQRLKLLCLYPEMGTDTGFSNIKQYYLFLQSFTQPVLNHFNCDTSSKYKQITVTN